MGVPPLRGGKLEFDAPKDQVVLIGEFIYTQANDVELLRDLEATKPIIHAALPDIPQEITLAQSTAVKMVRLLVCTP
jgi:hypothetical protein